MIWKISLHHDFSRSVPASGASCDLGQQLESALGRAEIRKAESHVRPHHAHQRDPMNVVALGDHLRTDQQIEFAFIERIQRAFEVFTAAHRVAIQTSDARLRKHPVQQLFELFRTCAQEIDILAAAMDARLGHRGGESAVVAFHAVRALVMRHRNRAVLALQRLAAGAAQRHRRISPPVEQHHDLLFAFEPLA